MNGSHGPWKPGKGKSIEAAAQQAWEHAKLGTAEAGFTAGKAPAGTYKLDIYAETENPIRGYIVVINPTGP